MISILIIKKNCDYDFGQKVFVFVSNLTSVPDVSANVLEQLCNIPDIFKKQEDILRCPGYQKLFVVDFSHGPLVLH